MDAPEDQPLSAAISALAERAMALRARADAPSEAPGSGRRRMPADQATSLGDVMALRRHAVTRAVNTVIDGLDDTLPETLPETPDALDGNPLYQWAVTERVLADIDAQRFEDSGRLPPAMKARYAQWGIHRTGLEPKVRAHLDALSSTLAAQERRHDDTPEPKKAPVQKRGAWR